jgi:hypothetical protein
MNTINPARQRLIEQSMRQQRDGPRDDDDDYERTSLRHRDDDDGDAPFAGRSAVPLPDQSSLAIASERRARDIQRSTNNRNRDQWANEAPPALHSIHKGVVKSIQSFGAFVAMEVCQRVLVRSFVRRFETVRLR